MVQTLVVGTGGLVRLTGSGLGCPTWPRCTADSFVSTPEMGVHGIIEFGNRLLTFLLVIVAIATFLAVLRLRNRGRGLFSIALAIGLGIPAQGVIGGITVLTGLNPYIVGLHFVVSVVLVVLSTVLVWRTYHPLDEAERSVPLVLPGPRPHHRGRRRHHHPRRHRRDRIRPPRRRPGRGPQRARPRAAAARAQLARLHDVRAHDRPRRRRRAQPLDGRVALDPGAPRRGAGADRRRPRPGAHGPPGVPGRAAHGARLPARVRHDGDAAEHHPTRRHPQAHPGRGPTRGSRGLIPGPHPDARPSTARGGRRRVRAVRRTAGRSTAGGSRRPVRACGRGPEETAARGQRIEDAGTLGARLIAPLEGGRRRHRAGTAVRALDVPGSGVPRRATADRRRQASTGIVSRRR
ncbi:COX15/CtaA family protein [Clavibacter zhangzhiyongii]|uniref:COX15/CtaA family protein n=1 Tax=Clavibacter zhangzhiyongii TaxID=2768071 RepID=UPI0039DF9CE4